MCSSQLTNAPLFTTNFISVPPITGKGPSTRRLLFTNEAPQLFMLIDSNTISSFSSDPLVPLSSSECAHLTSFDPIPSTPPPTVSLSVEASYYLQALQDNFENVRHDAVAQRLVGFADTDKGGEWEHYPTPRGLVARTKESPSTLEAALDVRTIAFDVVRKFPLNDCDEFSEDIFIHSKTMVSVISQPPHLILDAYAFRIKTQTMRIICRLRKVTIHLPALVTRSCPAGKLVLSFPIMGATPSLAKGVP
ncbi:hypothetical protein C8R41DRAFT_425257 [Lentinula lateritia]|uniref:Uncharacterized protein n=1 Tax=Lentinula lateritia TaxID=40482 RepID=A0ABQ8VVT3_9AGAR|nr:hypothetical protein C8R41DRAFT_425257 [Lentinula lateritia]